MAALTRIRILREQDVVAADPGEIREVDAATARELCDERGDAERVIDRSPTPGIEYG